MSRQRVQLGEYHAAYQSIGRDSGKPVLIFLHGFLGSGDNWQLLWPELAVDYHCIALDLLGFGASSKPGLKYTIWHQIEFLEQFIQALLRESALAGESLHLVGHSYGGWLAAAYTIATTGVGWDAAKTQWESPATPPVKRSCPSPQSLTLIAPAGIRDDSFVGRYNYMKPLLWETPIVDWGMNAIRPIAQILGQAKAFQQIDLARTALLTQPVAKSFIVDRLRPEDAIDTVERWLSHIAVPTLVIAGAQDTTIPLWHCETYGREVAGAQLEVFPTADHDLIQTHPGAIAQLIQHHGLTHSIPSM
jgi:pimeloyl-ACP methyl ester carboxylesterase